VELVDKPMTDLERAVIEKYMKVANAQVVDVGYGSVDWASKVYKADRKCFDQLAEWILNFMLYEDSGDKRNNPLSLSEAVEIKKQQGFEAPYTSIHRWVNNLPEYKQLQAEKKANPSKQARYERKQQEVKKSHDEKSLLTDKEKSVTIIENLVAPNARPNDHLDTINVAPEPASDIVDEPNRFKPCFEGATREELIAYIYELEHENEDLRQQIAVLESNNSQVTNSYEPEFTDESVMRESDKSGEGEIIATKPDEVALLEEELSKLKTINHDLYLRGKELDEEKLLWEQRAWEAEKEFKERQKGLKRLQKENDKLKAKIQQAQKEPDEEAST
jgi:hypothetical protein